MKLDEWHEHELARLTEMEKRLVSAYLTIAMNITQCDGLPHRKASYERELERLQHALGYVPDVQEEGK